MKKQIACMFAVFFTVLVVAQEKKVAVVTFYSDKMVGFSNLVGKGNEILATKIADLKNNPDFNLKPILQKFHDKFFNEYAKKFPFELVNEQKVLENEAYKNYELRDVEEYTVKLNNYEVYPGYKYIAESWFKTKGEKGMTAIFKNKANGTMYVRIHFDLEKGFGIGGTASVKMRAFARIALLNNEAKQVLAINESAPSKKTGVMVGGIPVIEPKKLLPMCESALERLLKDLDKRLPKLIKKANKKL